jgi:hypothetical protein
VPVDLDALDIRELVRLAKELLRTLEQYQEDAAATQFRVSIPVILAWRLFSRAAVSAEAELSRLGLPFRCPPTEGSHGRLMAVEGLREWLLRTRGSDEQGWAARELGPPIHQGELPNLALPLAELRVVVRRAVEALEAKESGADPARQPTRRRKARRRATARAPQPLTPKQTEAMHLVGEHKGNIAAAARAAGKSRTAMDKLYKKATAKLGKKAIKHFTQRLPQDNRGQETIAAEEEG